MRNLFLISVAVLAAGCGRNEEPAAPPEPMTPPAEQMSATPPAESSAVELQPTEGNSVSGTLSAAAEGNGVRFTGSISGLQPNSEHGFHVHENGDCSAPDASSAGGHFAPLSKEHGAPGPNSHVGDLGNLTADAQGEVRVDVVADLATLGDGAATDVMGKGVIVHAKADDLKSQPSGDAGARLACGVIR